MAPVDIVARERMNEYLAILRRARGEKVREQKEKKVTVRYDIYRGTAVQHCGGAEGKNNTDSLGAEFLNERTAGILPGCCAHTESRTGLG